MDNKTLLVYLAAPWATQQLMRERRIELRELGFVVTSRWIDEPPTPPGITDRDWWAERAAIDLEDLRAADCVILSAESVSTTGDKHFETGYAYGIGKQIIVVGQPENVFHHMRSLVLVPDWEAAKSALLDYAPAWSVVGA